MTDLSERAAQKGAECWNKSGEAVDAGVEAALLGIALLLTKLARFSTKAADWYKAQQVPRVADDTSANKPLAGDAK